MALQDMFAPTSSGYSDPMRDQQGGMYDWSNLSIDPAYFDMMQQDQNQMVTNAQNFVGGDSGYDMTQGMSGANPLDFIFGPGGQSIGDWGTKAGAQWNPQTNSFEIRRRVDAPGSAGWNDDRKYHYETANFGLGQDGRSLSQSTPWNQQAVGSQWMNVGPQAVKGLGMVLGAGALGGAFSGAQAAPAGNAMGMSDAIGAMGAGGDVGGALATGIPEVGAGAGVDVTGMSGMGGGASSGGGLEGIFGAKPMATPIPGAQVGGVGMNMTPAPGFGGGSAYSIASPELSASMYGGGAVPAAGAVLEQPMSASNYSDAAAGYGEGMSGLETGLFDSALAFSGSPGFASGVTEFAGPMMDNPIFDQLRKLKGLMGQKAVGNLSFGDLARGGLTAMNYRQNSKNLKNQKSDLQSMFGQNSAYAQQMKQSLERRDAAAGRRSQYGNREVELQGLLAGNAARLAPQVGHITDQQNAMRNQMYRTGGQFLNKGLGDNFLKDLFGG